MTLIRTALAFAVLAALPLSALAQTVSDPSADLAIMQKKAEAERDLGRMFEQFSRANQRPDMREMLEQQVMGRQGRRAGLEKPYPYKAMRDYQMAQQRAQTWSQLLAVDLNNDGQLTKEELTTVLALGERSSVADAFFASDANGDFILSHDELTAEVERTLGQNGRYDRAQMAELFDFDNDGSLTSAEFERGLVALGYATP